MQDAQSLKDDNVVDGSSEHSYSECFHYGECGQQYQVERMAMTLPEKKGEVDEGTDERDEKRPLAGRELVIQAAHSSDTERTAP